MNCPHCKILLEIVGGSLLCFECDFQRPMTMPELIAHRELLAICDIHDD